MSPHEFLNIQDEDQGDTNAQGFDVILSPFEDSEQYLKKNFKIFLKSFFDGSAANFKSSWKF